MSSSDQTTSWDPPSGKTKKNLLTQHGGGGSAPSGVYSSAWTETPAFFAIFSDIQRAMSLGYYDPECAGSTFAEEYASSGQMYSKK